MFQKLKQEMKSSGEKLKLTESIEALKADRKRLRCEKFDLLNQTKELYEIIESKENEIRDFLRHYELKTKETSTAVKKVPLDRRRFFHGLKFVSTLLADSS